MLHAPTRALRDSVAAQGRRADRTEESHGPLGASLRSSFGLGAEWVWLLDSSALPRVNALEELVAGIHRAEGLPEAAVLTGVVVGTDGEADAAASAWYRRYPTERSLEAVERQLLPVRAAGMPVLVHRLAMTPEPPPRPRLPPAGGVLEWTARVLRARAGYLVPGSESVRAHSAGLDPRTAASLLLGAADDAPDRIRIASELAERLSHQVRRAG